MRLQQDPMRVARIPEAVILCHEQAGRTHTLDAVVPTRELETGDVIFAAEVDGPARVVAGDAGNRRGMALLLYQAAGGQVQGPHGVGQLEMKSRRLLRSRNLAQGVERIEDADRGLQ